MSEYFCGDNFLASWSKIRIIKEESIVDKLQEVYENMSNENFDISNLELELNFN